MTRSVFFRSPIVALMALFFLSACENVDVDDEDVPFAVTNFIEQYFNGRGFSGVEKINDTDYCFTIDNGPTVTVAVVNDRLYNPVVELLRYTGNGETMPPEMAWDFFPEKLYNYVDGLECIDLIYDYEFDKAGDSITVRLLDTTVIYHIQSGKIEEA